MEGTDQIILINKRKRKKRDQFSAAAFCSALEGPLPFAKLEIDCLDDWVATSPTEPDHAKNLEQLRQGRAAIELAERLIAGKTSIVGRQQ